MANNIVKWLDLLLWRPIQRSINNAHAAWVSWATDKRSDRSRHPFAFQLVSNTVLNRFNVITKGLGVTTNPGLGGTFGAGATTEFAPSRALEGAIGAGCTATKLVTTTVMTAVWINMFANRGGSGDYWFKIRVIGKTAGKVEERYIVGNTWGTTPTVWLDKPLTFIPTATDTYEILGGQVFMLGAGVLAATTFRSMEVAANGITSLSNTNLPATIGTDSYMVALDEQYTPYNMEPGSWMVQGTYIYDSGSIVKRYALNASASGASSITWQLAIGNPTITIASPGIVTLTNHGLATGAQVFFTTTGALPTGIIASQVYYATVIDANTFKLTVDDTIVEDIVTSGTQSGTHSLYTGDSLILANEYRNFQIRVVQDTANPTSVNQRRIISSHTAWPTPVYTLGTAWTVTPSSSAKFVIEQPNLLLLRSTATATLYVYNYNKETINNGTNNILANAWSTTYFWTPSGAVGGGCMIAPSFGIKPDTGRNARHSFTYFFRGANTAVVDTLDIAGAINGVWASTIVYDGNQVLMNTGSGGAYAPCDNEGRFFYLNSYVASVNHQIYRFDVQNRVLSPYTPTSQIQTGTAAAWDRLSTYVVLKSDTEKYTGVLLQSHLSANCYELFTQI